MVRSKMKSAPKENIENLSSLLQLILQSDELCDGSFKKGLEKLGKYIKMYAQNLRKQKSVDDNSRDLFFNARNELDAKDTQKRHNQMETLIRNTLGTSDNAIPN